MKKLLYALLLLNYFEASYANDQINCNAEILTSMCGSGKVRIIINKQDMSFKLSHGDVTCWFSDFFLEGHLKEVKAPHHLFNTHQYQMINSTDETILGQFIIQNKEHQYQPLAQLTLTQNRPMAKKGARFGRYNLICQ
jgi:hypothetical protein